MISRSYLFLLFMILGFFNPITLLWFETSVTFIVVVPCTLLVWFAARWYEIREIRDVGNRSEVLIGLGVYALNVARNALTSSGRPMFGLFDMLVAFVSVCIAFYGLKGLRHFILPTAYLSILIIVYPLEFMITEVAFLENFLANLMVSMLNILTIRTSASGNVVTLTTIHDIREPLIIDAPCTGIKGMLAYGSLAILMILDVKTTVKRKVLCTVIGLIGTFLVNILRLLSIFLSCYFLGRDAAFAVHTYLGYGVFIVWVLMFWTVSFKYLLTPLNDRPST